MLRASDRGSERNLRGKSESASNLTAGRARTELKTNDALMERIVNRDNMFLALRRVESNKGSAGVDNMPVAGLRTYLKTQWPEIKEELLSGQYLPTPVRRIEIPKPGGKGMRKLGIPTVMDRLIQQAIHQILSPIFEEDFQEESYGFRPKRSAHDAVKAAKKRVRAGNGYVVDIDLEKFFDRVNHDILMNLVARKVQDKRVLKLIGSYLRSGIMEDGVVNASEEGTPQGGPLSPLLSNVLLNELDKELKARGHGFCRYADDCNIYVKSKRAGLRVLKSITKYLKEKLKLTVNTEKSAVDRPWKRKFLGYTMADGKTVRLRVSPESLKRLKQNLKESFRRGRGSNLGRFIKEELNPKLRGWGNYFSLSEFKGIFDEIDGWIRRRLRAILWRQAKCGKARAKKLKRRGLTKERAEKSSGNGRGSWWNSGASHMNAAYPKKYFDQCGLVSMLERHYQMQITV